MTPRRVGRGRISASVHGQLGMPLWQRILESGRRCDTRLLFLPDVRTVACGPISCVPSSIANLKEKSMTTNVKKLQDAKILPTPHKLSPSDEALVNGLDTNEVDALVKVKQDLGDAFVKRNTSLIL